MPKKEGPLSAPVATSAGAEQGATGAGGRTVTAAKAPQQPKRQQQQQLQLQQPQQKDAQQQRQQMQQPEHPPKKVKHECADSPTPARAGLAEAASQKRQRPPASAAPVVPQSPQIGAPSPSPSGALATSQSGTRVGGVGSKSREELAAADASVSPRAKQQRVRRSERPGDAIMRALSNIRYELGSVQDVDGVREQLSKFPEVVIVGGIAARRELLASLLGDSRLTVEAAAQLAAPGMRQPMCLELRWNDQDFSNSSWVSALGQQAQQAIGSRLKVDPVRLRVSNYGCSSLDVVQLPEHPVGEGGVRIHSPKIDDIRKLYLGSSTNLLACCEPGASLQLCRHFDPSLQRTVLIGAATTELGEEDASAAQSAVTLCGAEAARALEDRFQSLCMERAPQWLGDLERIEKRLKKAAFETQEQEQNESPDKILLRTQAAGTSFAHAFAELISADCALGPMMTDPGKTLEQELIEFASNAKQGVMCSVGASLSNEEAAQAADELFASFDGVKAYATYLEKDIAVQGAREQLYGFPCWKRLVIEIEVAMRLAHPSQQKICDLAQAAVRCGGTGVHGNQRWGDVAKKLMMSISFETLQTRINYIAARVVWTLRQKKKFVTAWMIKSSEEHQSHGAYSRSPIYAAHVEMMRNNTFSTNAIFEAYDSAAVAFAERVKKHLESTLMAGCISPDILMRPQTTPDMDPSKMAKRSDEQRAQEARLHEAGARVKAEMILREGNGSGSCAGLPKALSDKAFDPSKAFEVIQQVDCVLRRAFRQLAESLANQAVAFVDAGMVEFSKRSLEYAMFGIEFTLQQREALADKHRELRKNTQEVSVRLDAVHKCVKSLRQACYGASAPPSSMF